MNTKNTNEWQSHYSPSNLTLWHGRVDGLSKDRFHENIQIVDLTKPSEIPSGKQVFCFMGFCCDEGIRRNQGRLGAHEGPRALRLALANLPIPAEKYHSYLDAGDIVCDNGDLEAAQRSLSQVVALLLSHKITPILFGGGHEIAWGHFQGIDSQFPKSHWGIVNFDAHLDIRPFADGSKKGSSGTSFAQIFELRKSRNAPYTYLCVGAQKLGNTQSLLNRAKELDVQVVYADDFFLKGHEEALQQTQQIIRRSEGIYLSICLDVFASYAAPGVSAPQPFGLLPWHAIPFIRYLAMSGKVKSLDIAELSPSLDIDSRTAKLAAGLVAEFIHHT